MRQTLRLLASMWLAAIAILVLNIPSLAADANHSLENFPPCQWSRVFIDKKLLLRRVDFPNGNRWEFGYKKLSTGIFHYEWQLADVKEPSGKNWTFVDGQWKSDRGEILHNSYFRAVGDPTNVYRAGSIGRFDERKRLEFLVHPLGYTVEVVRNLLPTYTITQASGKVIQVIFESDGSLRKAKFPETTWTHAGPNLLVDSQGNKFEGGIMVNTFSSPFGLGTVSFMGKNGRVTRMYLPTGAILDFGTGKSSMPTKVQAPNGKTLEYTFDADAKLIKVKTLSNVIWSKQSDGKWRTAGGQETQSIVIEPESSDYGYASVIFSNDDSMHIETTSGMTVDLVINMLSSEKEKRKGMPAFLPSVVTYPDSTKRQFTYKSRGAVIYKELPLASFVDTDGISWSRKSENRWIGTKAGEHDRRYKGDFVANVFVERPNLFGLASFHIKDSQTELFAIDSTSMPGHWIHSYCEQECHWHNGTDCWDTGDGMPTCRPTTSYECHDVCSESYYLAP